MCNCDLFAIRQIVKQWTTMQHTTKGMFIIQPEWTRLLASQYHWCLLKIFSKLHNVLGILGSKKNTFSLNHGKMDGMISFKKNVKNTKDWHTSLKIPHLLPSSQKLRYICQAVFCCIKFALTCSIICPPLPPPCWFASFGSVIVLFVPSFLPCLDTGHSIAYE